MWPLYNRRRRIAIWIESRSDADHLVCHLRMRKVDDWDVRLIRLLLQKTQVTCNRIRIADGVHQPTALYVNERAASADQTAAISREHAYSMADYP